MIPRKPRWMDNALIVDRLGFGSPRRAPPTILARVKWLPEEQPQTEHEPNYMRRVLSIETIWLVAAVGARAAPAIHRGRPVGRARCHHRMAVAAMSGNDLSRALSGVLRRRRRADPVL